MRRSKHHWHVVLDERGLALPMSIEHDHQVNVGRRHAHYRSYDAMLRELREQGMPDRAARALAMKLDRTAYTTLDFDQPPPMAAGADERTIAGGLHPEVRRLLT